MSMPTCRFRSEGMNACMLLVTGLLSCHGFFGGAQVLMSADEGGKRPLVFVITGEITEGRINSATIQKGGKVAGVVVGILEYGRT